MALQHLSGGERGIEMVPLELDCHTSELRNALLCAERHAEHFVLSPLIPPQHEGEMDEAQQSSVTSDPR